MHIALADSNPGDRKQMERLLSRESDKRAASTGVFYTETYGSSASLLANPTVYNAYFLDITDEGEDSHDIAIRLREKGIFSPIVFCVSSIDYRQKDNLTGTFFIDKPIKVAQLSQLLDKLIQDKIDNHINTIEFRDNHASYYLEEDTISHISSARYQIYITMADGTTKTANGSIENVWHNVCMLPSYIPINNKTIVNMKHIKTVKLFSCIMNNGTRIYLDPRFKSKFRIAKKVNTLST